MAQVKFMVWSTHVDLIDGAYVGRDVVEVTRTDERTAKDDVSLISSILHRRSWVQKEEVS